MSLSHNEHKVFRSIVTNHYSSVSVMLAKINDCNEPCGLDMRVIVSVLGGLVKKKLINIQGMGQNTIIELTKKGIKKAEGF